MLGGQLALPATQRNVLLAGQGLAGDRPGVEAWCAGHPEEKVVAAARAGVLELAREAKELNRLNGELDRAAHATQRSGRWKRCVAATTRLICTA